jgi:ribose transport system substrate-binding protein
MIGHVPVENGGSAAPWVALPGLAATRDDVVESYQVVWHAPAPPELRKARRAHRRR